MFVLSNMTVTRRDDVEEIIVQALGNRERRNIIEILGTSPDGVTYDAIPYRDTADLMDTTPPLYSGDVQAKLHGGWKQHGTWSIRQTLPYPLVLRSTTVKYNASNP